MDWIGVIIVGATIGLLGGLVAPRSTETTPMWLTVTCGVAGAVVGWAVVGDGHSVLRWLASLTLGAALVTQGLATAGRDRARV